MGASSVTGVSGQYGAGAAYGQKGPGNKRDQFIPLSAPHIAASGVASVTGGSSQKIYLPTTLPLTPDKYIVVCNSVVPGNVTNTSGVLTVTGAGQAVVALPVDANGIGAVPGTVAQGGTTYAANLTSAGKTSMGMSAFVLYVATTGVVEWAVIPIGSSLDVNETARDSGATTTYPGGIQGAYPVQS